MHHDARIRRGEPHVFRTRAQQQRSHGCSLPDTQRRNGRLDKLHGVVDGHSGRHHSTGRIDVKSDFLFRIVRLKIQKLRTYQCRHAVFDRTGNENHPFFQKPGKICRRPVLRDWSVQQPSARGSLRSSSGSFMDVSSSGSDVCTIPAESVSLNLPLDKGSTAACARGCKAQIPTQLRRWLARQAGASTTELPTHSIGLGAQSSLQAVKIIGVDIAGYPAADRRTELVAVAGTGRNDQAPARNHREKTVRLE